MVLSEPAAAERTEIGEGSHTHDGTSGRSEDIACDYLLKELVPLL